MIPKDPTYNFSPVAQLVSEQLVTPQPKNKALGRGSYWEAEIRAFVDRPYGAVPSSMALL